MSPIEDKDILEIMQADLQRALKKPRAERRWAMAIDLKKCIGCHACTTGCMSENLTPPDIHYRPVKEEELGEYPNTGMRFLPRPCMQCDAPSCTQVCPVTATYKRDDGLVCIDYEKCIGCRYCLVACPYGARSADVGITIPVISTAKPMKWKIPESMGKNQNAPATGGLLSVMPANAISASTGWKRVS